jgi:hypothetical protein
MKLVKILIAGGFLAVPPAFADSIQNFQPVTISEWQSFTPTGSWTANVTYAGKWRRIGDSMEVDVSVLCSSSTTSATLSVNMPTGYVINVAKLAKASPSANDTLLPGYSYIRDLGGSSYTGVVSYNNTTSVLPLLQSASGVYTTIALVTQAAPVVFGINDSVQVHFTVPIVGWETNIQNRLFN